MKKLIILLLLPFLSFAQYTLRFPENETFKVSAFVDPNASFKEHGIDFGGELEFDGALKFMYMKVGFESFKVLEGNYRDVHGVVGINMVLGQPRREDFFIYAGLSESLTFRNGGYMINFGTEAGIDYNVSDNFFVGCKTTYVHRAEQELMGWTPEWKLSGYVRVGYKWDFKGYK